MTIRKRQVNRIVDELKEIRRISTMDSADFSNSTDKPMDLPKERKGVTAYVKRLTRLWRWTWLTEPLDRAIDQLEHELNR
ncbi:hypothetical protein LCGC14_0415750 [marine sediment metagenome]|uniref:Uncharacterized protein n=1 Tax=marine sediment metagenome TaxID=412755 RepID=A0A0F9SYE4_9ZZZZ